MLNYITIVSLVLLINGCGTLPSQPIEKIKVGMDRSDVLDIVGSPNHVDRQRQPHIWKYNIVKGSQMEVKEIHFLGHNVSYVGDPKAREPIPQEKLDLSKEEKRVLNPKTKKVRNSNFEKEIIKASEENNEAEEAEKEVPTFIEVK